MNKLITAFARSYKIKGRAKRTVEEMTQRLRPFIKYLESQNITHIDGITKDVITAYQTELYQSINQYQRPNSITYQNLLIGAVKQFMRFLKQNEYMVSDPSEYIEYAKEPQRLPKSVLTASEARKIMQMPDTKSLLGYRDRTVLEVVYSTGIRISELIDLKLGDVDYHDGFLRISGKGEKDRVVPLGKIACRYLENYIKSIRPELIKDPYNNHLFLSIRGNKLPKPTINRFIKIYAKKAKIKKNVHCHTFRHTCATVMLKNKANIRVIQELLGHSRLSTTQIYTHLSISDLKQTHKQCHPRERDKE